MENEVKLNKKLLESLKIPGSEVAGSTPIKWDFKSGTVNLGYRRYADISYF